MMLKSIAQNVRTETLPLVYASMVYVCAAAELVKISLRVGGQTKIFYLEDKNTEAFKTENVHSPEYIHT